MNTGQLRAACPLPLAYLLLGSIGGVIIEMKYLLKFSLSIKTYGERACKSSTRHRPVSMISYATSCSAVIRRLITMMKPITTAPFIPNDEGAMLAL
jgi:hypothetical protein